MKYSKLVYTPLISCLKLQILGVQHIRLYFSNSQTQTNIILVICDNNKKMYIVSLITLKENRIYINMTLRFFSSLLKETY